MGMFVAKTHTNLVRKRQNKTTHVHKNSAFEQRDNLDIHMKLFRN